MYYRRKILLALMQQFGGALTRTELQKFLFLFTTKQTDPAYDFIPYRYGCFSYQANQDVSTMIKYTQIEEWNSQWKVVDKIDYIKELKMKDRILLVQFYNKFNLLRGDELIKYVYENYPYYAINSEIAGKLLDKNSYQKIKELKPSSDEITLFTIGYENKSVEFYTNQLIKNDIKVLCDVRKNPLSMKYGFSKNQLKNIVDGVGIRYVHIPELGIVSDKRKDLATEADYNELFDDYTLNTLPMKNHEIEELINLFNEHKRIALTCFEADYNCCHRSRVSKAISEKTLSKYPVKHI
jgi:uncharacterized protein (DUF488 family)